MRIASELVALNDDRKETVSYTHLIHARHIFIKIFLDSRMHGKLTYRIFTVSFDKPGP